MYLPSQVHTGSRALRRCHCGGGGAPVNFGRRRAGTKKWAAVAQRGGKVL